MEKCNYCGHEGPKETAETIKENNPYAMTWLWPDEKWICNSCLDYKKRNIMVGSA